jgi:hypothetical protein
MENPAESFLDKQWAEFGTACGIEVGKIDKNTAINAFKAVMTKDHQSEVDYDLLFFEALKVAIGKKNISIVCTKGNAFVLKNRKVGFARQIDRSCLKLRKNHLVCNNNKSNHWCVVFDNENKVQDATAVVVLKCGKNNCNDFEKNENRVRKSPSAKHGHGPVAQTLLYMLDTWHCAARNGIQSDNSNTVHGLVLGVKSTKAKKNKKGKLCCVDIGLNVPEHCHDFFTYSINLAVKFDDKNYHEIAIAAYLRMMTIGLHNASIIEAAKKNNIIPKPISLCCRTLSLDRRALTDASLIASPIPGAKKLREDLSVHQGELFEFNPKNSLTLANGLWFSSHKISYPVLIKVCCTAVHDYAVHPNDCFKALTALLKNSSLKFELSKVLIAYIDESDTTSITIMRDLTKNHSMNCRNKAKQSKKRRANHVADSMTDTLFFPFTVLSPVVFKERMSDLWKAFSDLVKKVLLPMANLNVIHADIRPGWKQTSNILCQCHPNNASIELRLIDLESLMKFSRMSTGDGRCMTTSLDEIKSAHQFLWWQVMHVAYIWYEQLVNDDPETLLVETFVQKLFCRRDSSFKSFRKTFYKVWKDLCKDSKDSSQSIQKLLDTVQNKIFL